MSDLKKLAEKLTKEGPHKIEATPRRIRGLLGGKYVFDTTNAVYVWEHPYFPYFYIPKSAIPPEMLKIEDEAKQPFWFATLSSGGSSTDRVVGFNSPDGLKDLVRIEQAAITWFAEDDKILGSHPKDPYKRIETLSSSRSIRIEAFGKVLAESTQNVFLYETSLRPRFYLNPTNVNYEFLRESKTTTYCAYKGRAAYYDVVVDGNEIKDAVWYYAYPTTESAMIAGKLCFYNEKVDVFVDGVKENK